MANLKSELQNILENFTLSSTTYTVDQLLIIRIGLRFVTLFLCRLVFAHQMWLCFMEEGILFKGHHLSSMTTVSNASSGCTSKSTLAPSLNGYAMLPSMTKPANGKIHEIAVLMGVTRGNLLASRHRDFICRFFAYPFDSNPFGFGQTPTQICSRME